MGDAAKTLQSDFGEKSKGTDTRSSIERLRDAKTPQLVIALVGPVGTDINRISGMISDQLTNEFGYTCTEIKLSQFITEQHTSSIKNQYVKGDESDEFKRVTELIIRGNSLRKQISKSILADFAVKKIGFERQKLKVEEKEDDRRCYIINSIKNKAEYEILKNVYGELLYFLGIFSPYKIRKENLCNTKKRMTSKDAEIVMEIDARDDDDAGQNVTEAFSKADFFLRIDSSASKDIQNKIGRFLNLIFGTELITPTPNETAMYHASSAAGNSACLSRQVGAAITDKDGGLISIGWNDVPKFGGDLYMSSEDDPTNRHDNRCYNRDNHCYNDIYKNALAETLFKSLVKDGLIKEENGSKASQIIQKSFKDLIEFSRAIHAEMHAIISGSQKAGIRMRGGKLFCTTYPCHNCARHIIAAGIEEVYYIEPYDKSLAVKLHSDALTEDEDSKEKVKILMYDGVSPNRYLSLFKLSVAPRKNKGVGTMIKPEKNTAKPKETKSLEAIETLESAVTKSLEARLDQMGKTLTFEN
jgi:deoxycytidylate deaminase